ncbi:MAG: ribosome silencing factor [Lachnospiraceae bacterium]|nr:ribosome silencing factor [Lachnospiraceae bacterium]
MNRLKTVYDAIDEKKGEGISVLDIKELTAFSDYFVIATADNMTQLGAIVDNVEEKMIELYNERPKSIEGDKTSNWILMDYRDFVVHIFTRESRPFYDLDRIWKEGKEISF